MGKISRRNFLKMSSTGLLSLLLLPIIRLFSRKGQKGYIQPKEARHYGPADHLAG